MAAGYEYLFLTLARGPASHQVLADRLREAAGVGWVGQFAAQLGWAGNEAAVLLRGATVDPNALGPPLVVSARRERLTPTIRPGDADLLAAGGIYVHRWFEVEADTVDEFVSLSGQGWERFETLFDARIFGLFRADASEADRAAGVERLLLITRYGDHGVWEASRDPTTEAMQIFARRPAAHTPLLGREHAPSRLSLKGGRRRLRRASRPKRARAFRSRRPRAARRVAASARASRLPGASRSRAGLGRRASAWPGRLPPGVWSEPPARPLSAQFGASPGARASVALRR